MKAAAAWMETAGIQVLRFPFLEEQAPVIAGFTARPGGVSAGELGGLNWSYSVGDRPEAVAENRRRAFAALGLQPEQAVVAGLVHGIDVAVIDQPPAAWPDAGQAPVDDGQRVRRREGSGFVPGVDGLVTALPGIALVVTAADCAPVYVVDPKTPAVAAGHAGWRGTVAGVARALVATMQEALGCRPADLWAVVGPAIGPCCYEVDEPVIGPLRQAFPARWQELVQPAGQGHWHLDLRAANRLHLTEAGVPARQIWAEGPCTSCHNNRFFSHRAQHGRAGRGAAILVLRANVG